MKTIILKLIVTTVLLSQLLKPQFSITATGIESRCTANGAIVVTTSEGTGPFTFRLDTISGVATNRFPEIQNGTRFDALRPGTYRVTATDANGLSATVTVVVGGNYVLPTLSATVVGRTATLGVVGGRRDFRYTFSRNGIPSKDTSTQNVFRCLTNGDYLFILIDSCGNTFPYYTTVNVAALSFTPNCNAGTITAQSPRGGVLPYSFILKNTATGDSTTNATGVFTGQQGCVFTLTMRDSCGVTLTQPITCSASPMQVRIVCNNSQNGTTTLAAVGGFPPFVFRETGSNISNATGVFTGLPNNRRRNFTVTDACGQVRDAWVDPFDFDAPTYISCPFTGDVNLSSDQYRKDDPNCYANSYCYGSFFPVKYECLNCTPSVIVVDSGGVGRERSMAVMRGLPEGTFQIKVTTACGETLTKTVTLQRGTIALYASNVCNGISAWTSPSSGTKFYLKIGTTVIDSNSTGDFTNLAPNTYIVEAVSPTCGSISKTVVVEMSATVASICDSISVTICPRNNGYIYTLKRADGSIVTTNRKGGFGGLSFGQSFKIEVIHDNGTRLSTPLSTTTTQMPPLRVINIGFCSFDVGYQYSTYDNIGAYRYPVVFQVYDSLTNVLVATSTTGAVFGLQPNHTYRVVAVQQPNICGSKSIFIRTRAVDTPRFCIEPDYNYVSPAWIPTWDLEIATTSTNARLRNVVTNTLYTPSSYSSQTHRFYDIPPGKYVLVRDSCVVDSVTVPEFPRNLTVQPRASCPQFGRILAKDALTDTAKLFSFLRSVGWTSCTLYPRLMEYRLYNAAGTVQIGTANVTGEFNNLVPGQTYLCCSYLGFAQVACRSVTVPPYIRSTISATPPLLCPQDTAGTVIITISNGAAPFIVEITNLGRRIVTDSTTIVLTNVPRGNNILRVQDACLISADFNVSVGTLDPQLSFSNRECSGSVTLTATNYTAATYSWRDSTGRVIGNTATIVIQNNNNVPNRYTLDVILPRCTLSKTMAVPALGNVSTLVANAGRDTTVRTLTVQLNGNTPPNTSVRGVWRTLFSNPLPATFSDSTLATPSVSVTNPGRFGFIWVLTDGICATAQDTIFVTFIQCVQTTIRRDTTICRGDSVFIQNRWLRDTALYTFQSFTPDSCLIKTIWQVHFRTQMTITNVTVKTCMSSQVGIHRDTLMSILRGCRDSIIVTTTSLIDKIRVQIRDSTCNLLLVGIKSDTFQSIISRCDSIVERITTLRQPNIVEKKVRTCDKQQADIVRADTTRSLEGCLFITRTTFIYIKPDTIQRNRIACDSSFFNGNWYKVSGVYTQNIKSIVGCDSLFIVLNLTVNTRFFERIERLICFGRDTVWRGKTYKIAGMYRDTMIAPSGCDSIFELILRIQPKLELQMYPSDTTINIGDGVQVHPTLNFQFNKAMWTPKDKGVFCDTCLSPLITPPHKQLYKVIVTDSIGCQVTGEINIRIRPTPIYAPDAFSPNDDGINDYYILYGNPALAKIKVLMIYNRWGNNVFTATNVDLNAESLGWDGKYKHQLLPPDVFAFFAEIEYSNSETEIIKGGITLLR